jgi:hypothetical protein
MNAHRSPEDVLVIANRTGVTGLDIADGTLLWEHTADRGWPVTGVPLVATLDDGVVVVCSGKKVAWLRVMDGAVLGMDEVWFYVARILKHGSTLVVQGTGGLACYRSGVRTWGIVGVKEDPNALLFTNVIGWTTDAHGRPLKRAGALRSDEDAALVLGDSVAQIDRHSTGA